jgi:hypothetical protein
MKIVLPRQTEMVEQFVKHMAADAKILDEDEETGAKKYRYIRTGADHFSLAFTYAWLPVMQAGGMRSWLMSLGEERPRYPRENPALKPNFYDGGAADPLWEGNPALQPGGYW